MRRQYIYRALYTAYMDVYGELLLSQNAVQKIDVNNYIDHEIKYRQ